MVRITWWARRLWRDREKGNALAFPFSFRNCTNEKTIHTGRKNWRTAMRVRVPAYYRKFSCIAGKCEDTCCAGWEIDIDEASYDYYQKLPGAFGERVRGCIKAYEGSGEDVYEAHGFILKEGKRCPFLREDGLCEMILTLGEGAICDVCTYTPRNFLEYGGVREISISPSCGEAGRLIFGSSEKTEFLTVEEEGKLDIEESEEEILFGERIRTARDYGLGILQEREYSISERMGGFLCFGKEVQQRLNEEDIEGLEGLQAQDFSAYIRQAGNLGGKCADLPDRQYLSFLKRFASFSGLDSINEEWEQYLQDMQMIFAEGEDGKENYREALEGFALQVREEHREYEWEQLAVYLAFLMVSRCVDDWNFWGKVQFVAASWLFVWDMDALRYRKEGRYTREDRVDVMRIFAKEVEHSQDNLDYLEEEFLFEEVYSLEELLGQMEGMP